MPPLTHPPTLTYYPSTHTELLSKFREKNIDFAAHSNTEDGGAVFLNLLGNLAFPLLLVGGLFLLSRRSGGAGGMGGPGGNNPLAFGEISSRNTTRHTAHMRHTAVQPQQQE